MKRAAFTVMLSMTLCVPIGCSRRTSSPAPKAKPTQAVSVPLPEWAPKDPSPEFLRAAKRLKPMPPDLQQQGSKVEAAMYQRMAGVYPAAFELFGTLDDQQVQQLLSTGRCLIPVRSMPAKQRTILDGYFRAFREAFRGFSGSGEGIPAWTEDLATILYQSGAREDLSNVGLLFTYQGHAVNINFETRTAGEKSTHAFGCTIGTM